jgi:phosphocarrier protein FPr
VVGIVIVSHSPKLAEGVAELARNMGGAEVRIEAAGGGVYSDDGVIVLMDLGSAVLSAEMAVEMLPEEKGRRVILCEAPLVEGAIAASARARIGGTLQEVAAEARQALAAKAEHLHMRAPEPDPLSRPREQPPGSEQLETRVMVRNSLGLHARAAGRLVETAGGFANTEITVKNLTTGQGPASAKSIMGIMTLGVLEGHEILVSASGLEAQAALDAIQHLADDNFGDVAA